MSIVLTSGILALSIDAELDVERRGLDQQRSLERVTGELADLLAKYRVAATWALADPAVSAATDRVTHSGAAHEIAILGDRSWVGREAGRTRFARELARRVTRGRAAGFDISTLLLRDAELDDHLDLVVKQGLSAIASGASSVDRSWFSGRSAAPPLSLRFGLWSIPTQATLPGSRASLWLGGGSNRVRRLIDAAIVQRGICHVSINGLAVAAKGPSALHSIERVLRHADKRRAQGTLCLATLAAASQRLTGGRQAAPARSILRPAA